MTPHQLFDLIYAPAVKGHLKAIEPKYHSLIRSTIEIQLQFEPDVETKNRKPLKRSVTFETSEADWEIRFGPGNRFRVFYQVNRQDNTVYILAVGEKKGAQLLVGGKEVTL